MRWFRWHPRHWLTGTSGLSWEQRGVYATLISLMYDRRGTIEDDIEYLKRNLGGTARSVSRVRQELLDLGKIQIADGMISNERAMAEIEWAKSFSATQSERGAQGGRPKVSAKFAGSFAQTFSKLSASLERKQRLRKTHTRERYRNYR